MLFAVNVVCYLLPEKWLPIFILENICFKMTNIALIVCSRYLTLVFHQFLIVAFRQFVEVDTDTVQFNLNTTSLITRLQPQISFQMSCIFPNYVNIFTWPENVWMTSMCHHNMEEDSGQMWKSDLSWGHMWFIHNFFLELWLFSLNFNFISKKSNFNLRILNFLRILTLNWES